MRDPNACGNPHIDGLAHRGRLETVWAQLEYRYPAVKAHTEAVWIARKTGTMRRLVEREPRYQLLMENAAVGPQTQGEWDLLAEATLVAIGQFAAPDVTLRNVA